MKVILIVKIIILLPMFMFSQWCIHNYPTIGHIDHFDIVNDTIYGFWEEITDRNENFHSTFFKIDIDGNVLFTKDFEHPEGRSNIFSSVLFFENESYLINRYLISGEHRSYLSTFRNEDFTLLDQIRLNDTLNTYNDSDVLHDDRDRTMLIFSGVRGSIIGDNSRNDEISLQKWNGNRLENVDFFKTVFNNSTIPLPNGIIDVENGYLGMASYESNTDYLIYDTITPDTHFTQKTYLYQYDLGGSLIDTLRVPSFDNPEDYSPIFSFSGRELLKAEDGGYYLIGHFMPGRNIHIIKMNSDLEVEWRYDNYRDVELPDQNKFFQLFLEDAVVGRDGYIYLAGWNIADINEFGVEFAGEDVKQLVKFDPLERRIVWISRIDDQFGRILRIEEANNGKFIISGSWDDRFEPIENLNGLGFDARYIASIDSSGQLIKTTSIEEVLPALKVKIFPNPSSDILTLELLSETEKSYLIFDELGRVRDRGVIGRDMRRISIRNLPKGRYEIIIKTRKNRFRASFIRS